MEKIDIIVRDQNFNEVFRKSVPKHYMVGVYYTDEVSTKLFDNYPEYLEKELEKMNIPNAKIKCRIPFVYRHPNAVLVLSIIALAISLSTAIFGVFHY